MQASCHSVSLPTHLDGPFLSLEEVNLENQPTPLDPFYFSGFSSMGFFEADPWWGQSALLKSRVMCGSAICLVLSCQAIRWTPPFHGLCSPGFLNLHLVHCCHLALLNWQLPWLCWCWKWVPPWDSCFLFALFFCVKVSMLIIVFNFTSLSDDGSQHVNTVHWLLLMYCAALLSTGLNLTMFFMWPADTCCLYGSHCCSYGVLVLKIAGRLSQANKSM